MFFDEIGINHLSYKLRCCLLTFSLAPATIGALARILTNREQDSGRREEKKFFFFSHIALRVFERRRTLPRVDGEIGGQQTQTKVTTRS